MPDDDPRHLAGQVPSGGRWRALRARAARAPGPVGVVAVAALVVAALVGAGLGARSLLPDGGDTGAGGRVPATATTAPATTDRPTPTTGTPTTRAPTTTAPTTTTTVPPGPEADGVLRLGERGDAVLALQRRLVELGYWLGEPDGTYGQLTRQAVMAFQKVEGLGRDGVAGPVTTQRLAEAGRPAPRGAGGLEIDLARQVLLVVDGGRVGWVVNASTGTGEAYARPAGGTGVATTPTGHFTVQREIDGLREAPLGTLYRPKYFHGGIAVHGSGSVPATPASHGCVRVTNSAMDMLWSSGAAAIGTPVWVY